MLNIYLIRHGETQFNTLSRVQGWNDSPLTELGLFQAKCTGYGLRNIEFIRAYSGDTKRQIDTANAVISQNLKPFPLETDFHFREMNYGKYQGGSYYDMLNPLYEMFDAEYDGYDGLLEYMSNYEIAEAICKRDETGQTEGPERLYRRFSEGLDMLTSKFSEGNILLSTSSCAICVLTTKLFPELKQKYLVSNASITIIGYEDGRYHLSDYNNISYRSKGEEHFRKK